MGEFDNNLAVKVRSRLAAVPKFIKDNEQIVAGAINVIQPKVDTQYVPVAIVLKQSAGQPFATKGKVEAIVDLMKSG